MEHLGVPDVPDVAPAALVRLPDGTIKQVSPLTGTVVWTVPGRAHRPFAAPAGERNLLGRARDRYCAFCPDRPLDVPPEKARLVLGADGAPTVLRDVPAEQLKGTVAELRRIPNLFEILAPGYWRANHGYQVPAELVARATAYTATPQGRDHVLAILRRRLPADGLTEQEWAATPEETRLERGVDLFAGTHDVVVARRHFVDGAVYDDELAGSGTLTPDEHHRYVAFTAQAAAELYAAQPYARYVAVFQNWLRPAGASFDHLHKQLVAIDEHGPRGEQILARERSRPGVFNLVVDHAVANRLVVAENERAVAVAGVGHRYPSLEVYSTSDRHLPWEHTDDEVRAVSDLLHALHAATGTAVPTNEEWQHRPPDVDVPMPWHIVLKWRVSTLAGFEGGTKINVNTLDPFTLRDRVVAALVPLRDAGAVEPMRVGDECTGRRGRLRYVR
ncbi:DUF4921 family protein [Cellulomonas sp. KRMCY2]|uniref:DUF4921 family protein n=1 Tax=Cellulomonas sp. KRMCY2 TaxID=1304865 RepID=UPI00045E8392|nr:DUF4921 family protein [Cellulomonas sp. KRMCY2]